MKTRDGIYYDFTVSEYRHTVDGLTYVFSSQLHLDKFKERLEENRNSINTSLTNRFNISVDVSQLADMVLYRKIEKRGFLVLTDEGNQLCQNNHLKYVGGTATYRSSNG